jgi:hypothetical protein
MIILTHGITRPIHLIHPLVEIEVGIVGLSNNTQQHNMNANNNITTVHNHILVEFKNELKEMSDFFANECEDTKTFINEVFNTPNVEFTYPTGLIEYARDMDWLHEYDTYRANLAYQGIRPRNPSVEQMKDCLNQEFVRTIKAMLLVIAAFDDDIEYNYTTLIENQVQEYMDRCDENEFS